MKAPAWRLGDGASQPRHVLRSQDLPPCKPGPHPLRCTMISAMATK